MGRRGQRSPITPVDRYVSAAVRERRNLLGLTRVQVAGSIGITGQQLAKYEQAYNRLSVGMLCRLAEALGIRPEALFPPMDARTPLQMPDHMSRQAARLLRRAQRLSPEVLDKLAVLVGALAEKE